MNDILQIILYLGSIQGLLLSVLLFSILTNKISNRLLALLTLSWGSVLRTFALIEEGLYARFPHLLMLIDQLLFLFFPLLYLQVKYLLTRHTKFHLPDLLHFLPFLISILFNIEFFLLSGEEKLYIVHNSTEYFNILEIVSNEVIAFQGVIYSILAIRLIKSYQKKIREYESTVDKSIIKVLYIGISLNLFSWIIGIIGIHLDFLNIDLGINFFAYTYLVLVIVIYGISYSVVKSPEIFKLDINTIRNNSVINKNLILKPKKSKQDSTDKNDFKNSEDQSIQDPLLITINEQLIKYMKNEKPYLNPELSLSELANSLNISRNQLSGIINQLHKINFYEFVNQYRIKEVKQLMEDPSNKHLKLISLAYDAGFNSKASFNRIFKQITNMTPSKFISDNKTI
ncbi:MAG: helix-turn-helix domain-containing protein [Bacteroidales bacterium]|nr:helix-turn-helix domain-containing protein [Bacteroidales bacterium]